MRALIVGLALSGILVSQDLQNEPAQVPARVVLETCSFEIPQDWLVFNSYKGDVKRDLARQLKGRAFRQLRDSIADALKDPDNKAMGISMGSDGTYSEILVASVTHIDTNAIDDPFLAEIKKALEASHSNVEVSMVPGKKMASYTVSGESEIIYGYQVIVDHELHTFTFLGLPEDKDPLKAIAENSMKSLKFSG